VGATAQLGCRDSKREPLGSDCLAFHVQDSLAGALMARRAHYRHGLWCAFPLPLPIFLLPVRSTGEEERGIWTAGVARGYCCLPSLRYTDLHPYSGEVISKSLCRATVADVPPCVVLRSVRWRGSFSPSPEVVP
jgi:hypothetical protein